MSAIHIYVDFTDYTVKNGAHEPQKNRGRANTCYVLVTLP